MKKCNICNEENEKNTHYCKKCGKNLSNTIEKTDILFFLSNFLKFIALFIIVFILPWSFIFEGISNNYNYTIFLLIICAILFIIMDALKRYSLRLCKKNLK